MKFFRFFISKVFFFHLGLIIVFYVIVIAGVFYGLKLYTHHGESVEVPDFTNRSIKDVKRMCDERSLLFLVHDSVYQEDMERGAVFLQSPPPGFKVKEGRKIYLTVNAAVPPKVEMPRLCDIDIRSAQSIVEAIGLKLNIEYVPGEDGLVKEQRHNNKKIEPGVRIYQGSEITLVVGKGGKEDKKYVPNVKGMTLEEAQSRLTDYGLIGQPVFTESPGAEEDSLNAVVIDYNHKGSRVSSGTVIRLEMKVKEKEEENTDNP